MRNYAERVHDWAAPLSEEEFWEKPFPFGNSFGHLVLHLTGNLNYYIGAVIANTGYVRDRNREFIDPTPPTKEKALAEFDAAIEMAIQSILVQTMEQWTQPYAATGMPDGLNRLQAVLQCTSHIYHHVGQMIYLQKQWQSLRSN